MRISLPVTVVSIGLGLGACLGYPAGEQSGDAARKPNIVFILADDMGWKDIGYHGSEIKTPTLDRLAQEGMVFNQHYVTPTCTPTRVGLLSGQYPSRFGVVAPAYGRIFNDDTVTLAEALKRSGYTTHISGKWHMGSPPEHTPLKYGFTSSYGYFAGQIDPYTHRYKSGSRTWHRNDQLLDEPGHATDLITDEAMRVIKAEHDQPFFLYVAYSVPHYPLDEPDEWVEMYPDITEASRRWFAASVTHMDHGIARIVEALEAAGLREDTLLVFASDNGGERSWRSETQYEGKYADLPHTRLGDNRPLRGWKAECHEGAIRVPAFVNWPGVLSSGEIDVPVHIVDWMPTLCALAGFEPDGSLPWDGQDIWPVIEGTRRQVSARIMYWKTSDALAVRMGDWKLIVSNKGDYTGLFNLKNDPNEEYNLADQEPERIEELTAVLQQVAAMDRKR